MSRQEILEEIKRLTPEERLVLFEDTFQLIRQDLSRVEQPLSREERKRQLAEQAKLALPYYQNDEELTIFTALDGEDVYDYEEE